MNLANSALDCHMPRSNQVLDIHKTVQQTLKAPPPTNPLRFEERDPKSLQNGTRTLSGQVEKHNHKIR
jgi:hypothetical protein